MACTGLSCLGDGGCIEALANGTLGQVLTMGAAGAPAWANAADDQTAAEVPVTPVGNIGATDVQAALQELDTEKLSTVLTSSGIQGTGVAGDAVRENFDNLPVDNAALAPVTDSFVVSTATYPDGARATRETVAEFLLCNAPASPAGAQPGSFIVTRDPGTGCSVENFTPVKQVTNAGAALPIASVAAAGQQNLLALGVDDSAETNDIIPYIGADGIRRWDIRPAYLEVVGVDAATVVTAGVYTTIPFTTLVSQKNVLWAKPVATIVVPGIYLITAQFRLVGKDYTVSQGIDITIGVNSTTTTHELNGIVFGTSFFARDGATPRIHGARVISLNAGDTVQVISYCTAFTENVIADIGAPPQPAFFSITRMGPQ